MTKKTVVVSLSLLSVLGATTAAMVSLRHARACSDCDGSFQESEASPPANEAVSEGHSCTLDRASLAEAKSELRQFAGQTMRDVHATVTASFAGEKERLEPVLSAIIEREASCCSHLDISMLETDAGYDVTVRAGRHGIDEIRAILTTLGTTQ